MRIIAFLCALTLLVLVSPSAATTDSESESDLMGLAGPDARYAVIVEGSIQDGCNGTPCNVYVLDTRRPVFRRLYLTQLRARSDELRETHCIGKVDQECWNVIEATLQEENSRGYDTALYARFLSKQPEAIRRKLGTLRPPADYAHLRPKDVVAEGELKASRRFSFVTDEGKVLTVDLEERWSLPSHRATSHEDAPCWPAEIPACHREDRWVDGEKFQDWVCPAAPSRQKHADAPLVDCAGRASLVRVTASVEGGLRYHGQSQLVSQGFLIQDRRSQVTSRRVDLETLRFASHTIDAYALPHAVLVIGAFAHGLFLNGTYFPAVVVIPRPGRRTP